MNVPSLDKLFVFNESKRSVTQRIALATMALLMGVLVPLSQLSSSVFAADPSSSALPSLPDPEENTARTNYPVPAGVTGVWVTLIGAGGGGGGGGDTNSGVRTGGGGGGGGAVIQKAFIPASQLGSTYSVSVGAGGAAGAAGNNSNGVGGKAGGASFFKSGSTTVSAGGGGGGGFGTLWFEGSPGSAGTASVVNVSGIETLNGGAGGIGSSAFGGGASASNNTAGSTAGGGGGGGIGLFGDVYAGGNGGNSVTAQGGTAAPKNTATSGGSASATTAAGYPGAGGGAASAVQSGRGGDGGNGSIYGGGAGGGAGGTEASNGGTGAGGYTLIEWTPTATVFLMAGNAGDPNAIKPYMKGQAVKGQVLVPINYPNLKQDTDNDMLAAAAILNDKLVATPGKKVVFTHSLGAVAASTWLKMYGPTSTIDPSDLEFILLGNSARPYNGYYPLNNWKETSGKPFVAESHVAPISDTRYKVQDIALQYDGWADWPNNRNISDAVGNANLGMWAYHLSYGSYPLDRYDYRKYQVGNITYTLIPVNQWWSSASALTKIESAYTRPM